VEARRELEALEGLLLDKTFANQLQNGHLLIGPFDLALALFGQGDVLNVASE
jgi:hypothetical protein